MRTLLLAACTSIVCLIPAAALAQTPSPTGPSFSCAQPATPIEQAICSTPSLAAADRQMADLYAMARISAFGTGPSNELSAQRQALKDMKSCTKPPTGQTLVQCLQSAYADRNDDLALAILMRSPTVALPILRQTDPSFAPIAEAIQLWASQPVATDWSAPALAPTRARIITLLKPFLTDMQTKDEQSFGREILSDPSTDGIAVKRIEDIFLSERHFAAFLNILGPYLPDNDSLSTDRRSIPCAAILRHPALLAATDSVFGSTMDNMVLDSDCGQTLPPTPALDNLDSKLNKAWPECEGTIRFAAYRTHAAAMTAAALGLAKHDPKSVPPHRRGILPSDITAARAELAAYYVTYLNKPQPTADTMAADAINAILSTAQECD